MRQLCKGNVAVIKGAILAGCSAYYGYPITPASEIAEAAALYLPEVGGTFVQAEGGEELFVRRDSVQIKGEGLIGLGRVPERDSPLTIRFYCEEQ